MTNNEQSLGDRVAGARRALKWSQAELGKHIGISQATVHRIETGAAYSVVVGRALLAFCEEVASGTLKPEPAPTS